MNNEEMLNWSIRAAQWSQDYYKTLSERPVRSQAFRGQISNLIPKSAPENPEPMETVFADFERIIPDGMTHWQHPRFFAYFSSIASPPSILAEQLINSLACNCMLWQTSPAATELEERMVEWFRDAVGLSSRYKGLIQDSATLSTLCAILTMRERSLNWSGNKQGMHNTPRLRIYASHENHSSIDKAIRIAGIGQDNLVNPLTKTNRSIDANSLRDAIDSDIAAGYLPAGIILCVGGTATGAVDDLKETLAVAKEFNLYSHVDAAWAGSAMICPEYRWIWDGIEMADSIVINPTKMIGIQMDSSIHLLADPFIQSKTVGIRPDYLKTDSDTELLDYSEFTIPLGRKFRALKFWFQFRAYGLSGLRELVRNHVCWNHELRKKFHEDPDFDVWIETPLSLFGFCFKPTKNDTNNLTDMLLNRINDDGRIYLTKTVIDGRNTIRVTGGTHATTQEDVMMVYDVVREIANDL